MIFTYLLCFLLPKIGMKHLRQRVGFKMCLGHFMDRRLKTYNLPLLDPSFDGSEAHSALERLRLRFGLANCVMNFKKVVYGFLFVTSLKALERSCSVLTVYKPNTCLQLFQLLLILRKRWS
jgi:hypothetical protein